MIVVNIFGMGSIVFMGNPIFINPPVLKRFSIT